MALHFDGSTYIQFPNPSNSSVLTRSLAILYKPSSTQAANQYLLHASDSSLTSVGGLSAAIYINDADIIAYVGRDSLKYNRTTTNCVKFGQWNLLYINCSGYTFSSSALPYIMNEQFPTYSSLAYETTSNVAGSGNFVPASGPWTIGARHQEDNFFTGDIEYIAVLEGNSIFDLSSVMSGIGPNRSYAQKFLKFFIKLSDPNNIVDIVSGQKGRISGTLTESTSHPRVTY